MRFTWQGIVEMLRRPELGPRLVPDPDPYGVIGESHDVPLLSSRQLQPWSRARDG